jgi:hypothetical protein
LLEEKGHLQQQRELFFWKKRCDCYGARGNVGKGFSRWRRVPVKPSVANRTFAFAKAAKLRRFPLAQELATLLTLSFIYIRQSEGIKNTFAFTDRLSLQQEIAFAITKR